MKALQQLSSELSEVAHAVINVSLDLTTVDEKVRSPTNYLSTIFIEVCLKKGRITFVFFYMPTYPPTHTHTHTHTQIFLSLFLVVSIQTLFLIPLFILCCLYQWCNQRSLHREIQIIRLFLECKPHPLQGGRSHHNGQLPSALSPLATGLQNSTG